MPKNKETKIPDKVIEVTDKEKLQRLQAEVAKLQDEGAILSLPPIKAGGIEYTPILRLRDVKVLKIKRNIFGRQIEVTLKE